MEICSCCVGPIGTNCYAVVCDRRAYLIDPGAEPATIAAMLEKMDFDSLRILLTHAHFDHIGAAGEIARRYQVKAVEMAPGDRELYFSRDNAMPPYCPPAEDLPPAENFQSSGDFVVLPMPGHTPGGVALRFARKDAPDVVFVGDSVFAGSIGRTDLWGGDLEALLASIKREILPLDEATILYCGHGPETSVGAEKRANCYFR